MILAEISQELDGIGIYGTTFFFSITIAFFFSAVLIFFYLWRKGSLDFDEEPARLMCEVENSNKEQAHE